MALPELQTQAYRAVLRAVAATQLDWVRTEPVLDRTRSVACTALPVVINYKAGHNAAAPCSRGGQASQAR